MCSVDVSVVIPVKNGVPFLTDCLESLLSQDFTGTWEVSIYNDGSSDGTEQIVDDFKNRFLAISVPLLYRSSAVSNGVGYAKNQAVRNSTGKYLCFCDADDISDSSRLRISFTAACTFNSELVFLGSCFCRIPEDSTSRYTRWANSLSDEKLQLQVFTSHGPTLIAPTWFLSRKLFDLVGGLCDVVKTGFPEDLDFFFKALKLSDVVFSKINEELVVYRYHEGCASFGVHEKSIWDLRMDFLRDRVLPKWEKFTIWNAGKQGKRFFKSLTEEEKQRVEMFCDVDEKKIRHGSYEEYDDTTRKVVHRVPIVHVKNAKPPLVVCVKLDLTGGHFERLIDGFDWVEATLVEMPFVPVHPDEQKFVTEALEVVKAAGRLIRDAFDTPASVVHTKASNVDLVTETDQAVEKLIIGHLKKCFPDHKFIGEESVADGAKIEYTDAPTWIIDPIDGTTNFVHRIPMIAVCVGLAIKKELRAGIVFNPITQELFYAQVGLGAFKNGLPIHASKTTEVGKSVILTQLGSHRNAEMERSYIESYRSLMIQQQCHGHRSFGSAAINMIMVAQGSCDGYAEYGIHSWDVAAAAVIVTEAGGVVIDPTGAPFNVMSRKVLCTGTPELAKALSATLTHAEYEPEA